MATSSPSDSPARKFNPNSPSQDLPQDPLLQHGSFIDHAKNAELAGNKRARATIQRQKKGAKEVSDRPSSLSEGCWARVRYVQERDATAKTTNRPSEIRPSEKKKKSKSGSKCGCPMPPTPVKFDLENVPNSITWKLNLGSENLWDAYIDDNMVPISDTKEWRAVLQEMAPGISD